ncbi:WecB/TagA/CpsF family glycosyltransferase [Microbacterium sp. MTN4-26]|uniref:WecB/TagA/CpsF family glycosyltransferase n=1 Tax=Microbacterium sp. MTN4-26 TaxID=3056563 RepID=UPI0036F2D87E
MLRGAGLNLPDGAPVVVAMRAVARSRSAGRVRGPSLFTELLRQGCREGKSFYFLGGDATTLSRVTRRAALDFPGLSIAGEYSPPFQPLDESFVELCREAVLSCEAKPDVVLVALGTPKQDILGLRLTELTGITTVAVGAAFGFYAGTVREAPVWMRRVGLEWAFRLITEPRRLWKRYIIGNMIFVALAGRSIVKAWVSGNG